MLQGCCKLSWLRGELRTLPEAVLQQWIMEGVVCRCLKPSPEQKAGFVPSQAVDHLFAQQYALQAWQMVEA